MNNPLSVVFIILATIVAIPCPDNAVISNLQQEIKGKDNQIQQLYTQALKDAKQAAEEAKKNCIR